MESISIFLIFFPLISLLWLANIADKRRNATPPKQDVAIFVYALLFTLWIATLTAGIFLLLMGMAYSKYADIAALSARYSAQGLDPEMVVNFMQSLPRLGAGLAALAFMGITLMLSPVQKCIARFIPIRPGSAITAVTLAYSVLILVNLWLVIGVGMDALATAMEMTPQSSSTQMMILLWTQSLLLFMMAFVGVGWLSRRSWQEVLSRLGLTWRCWRDAGVGIGLGLLMFLLLFSLTHLLNKTGLGVDQSIEKLTEHLLGPLTTTLPGIMTLGVAAALGEELVYRGALQPRFGIVLTALFFALTHNQYGISLATLIVFLLGLVLGWTRRRYNTTTAIFLHATYNIAIGLAGWMLH